MLSKAAHLCSIGPQNPLLAPFKRSMRTEHRRQWQAPQQYERPSRNASSPITAADEQNGGNHARSSQSNVSRSPQRNQIGIVFVRSSENEGYSSEPDQDQADTFETLHEK
ncbi:MULTISPECIES: hypothetical protein [unclassified Bradyrhizobium]|uniref:hypothetical protein n=1 Tax=unclassified Bradyrhizobium TaxID=2631580 RepID=UPI002FF1854E